jgi:hypothetical protein
VILPDDGTAELGGNNRDEQIGALATNFQLFKRKYEADEETKFQRFKEQTKRMKLTHTAVSKGLSWKVTTAHPEKGKAVISSLREISCNLFYVAPKVSKSHLRNLMVELKSVCDMLLLRTTRFVCRTDQFAFQLHSCPMLCQCTRIVGSRCIIQKTNCLEITPF